MNNKKTPKQIAALTCVVLLVLLYIATFIAAFFAGKGGTRLFVICAALTIIIPIATWGFIWMIGKLTNKHTIADLYDENNVPAIKNVIFDIGNVLTNYRWHDFMVDKGYTEEQIERLAKATVYNAAWSEFDRGVFTEEEILQAFIKEDPEIEDWIRHVFADVKELVTKRDFAIPWLEDLKSKGYKVYYLSNFSEKAKNECADALDFIPHMDGGFLSYTVKMIKPDAKFYNLLLDTYNLKAGECVFIDDTPKNIEAGEALGIRGIVYKDYEQVKADLAAMGVK